MSAAARGLATAVLALLLSAALSQADEALWAAPGRPEFFTTIGALAAL